MKKIAKGIWQLHMGETENFTPVKQRGYEMKEQALEQLSGGDELPFHEDTISVKTTTRGVTITLPMESSEDIYGFGLQLLRLNAAGRKRYIKVNSDPRMDTGESHAPAPFYLSTKGYGLFVDTFRYTTFYLGTVTKKGDSSGKTSINQAHEEFSESALYSLKKAKEQRQIIIEIPGVKGVDLYFFAGDVQSVVQRYNLFSGGGCLPPMWSLGMWYRAYGGSDEHKVQQLADEFRHEHMPIDVMGIEPGWQSHSYSCTYEWSNLFPHHQEMINHLNQSHYHINLWEHVFVYPAAAIYQSLLPYSGNYEVWNGLVPDFATEKAKTIFGDWHIKQFIRNGISGFKLDECDNSDYNASNWSFPDSTVFPSGMDGEQMHNAIGVLYQTLMAKSFEKSGKQTLSEVRSSGSLAAPLPFVLYSDLYGHKEFIRGMITSSLSGMLWAPEVRSCENGTDLLRRVETAIFSPQALLNCWRIPNAPWKQVDINKNLQDQFMDDADVYTAQCRELFQLRMSLLPYFYSAFGEYHEQGVPPIRPLVMAYPNDLNVRNIDDQYLFGSSLLVCPLTLEDGTSRKIYLPEGTWYDFFDSTKSYPGGQYLQIRAAVNEIPVFVKSDTILPVAKAVEFVTDETIFEMTLRNFGTGVAETTLYSDEDTTPIIIKRDDAGHMTLDNLDGHHRYLFSNIN